MLIRFSPNLILTFAFRPPICEKKISAKLKLAYASYSNFYKVCEKKNKKKTKKNFKVWLLASQEWVKESSSNLECSLNLEFGMWVEDTSTVNLVPFIRIGHHRATDAWKSRVCCSCQYTHSICACPVFLGCTTHYTAYLDLPILFQLFKLKRSVLCYYASFLQIRSQI